MEYRYLAVVLKKKDIGEADRLYTVYSRENGKIRAFARGVRKSNARLAAQLENFSLVSMMVMRGRGVGNIKSVVIEKDANMIRSSLDAMYCGFEAANIFDRFVEVEHKDERMFFLWVDFLEALERCLHQGRESSVELSLRGFMIKFLEYLGYPIEANVCVACRGLLTQEGCFFGFQEGGVICDVCRGGFSVVFPISNETVKTIRIFQSNALINIFKLHVSSSVLGELRRIEAESFRFLE